MQVKRIILHQLFESFFINRVSLLKEVIIKESRLNMPMRRYISNAEDICRIFIFNVVVLITNFWMAETKEIERHPSHITNDI